MKVDDLSDPDTNTLISSTVQHAGFGMSKNIKRRSASERYRANRPIAEVFCHATEGEQKKHCLKKTSGREIFYRPDF